MSFLSLSPFVPSGADFAKAKAFFQELGFRLVWDAGDYAKFESGACQFILQHFDDKAFAENFMVSVNVTNADEFWKETTDKGLAEKYGIRLSKPVNQSYGREVNLTDIAGVCLAFCGRINFLYRILASSAFCCKLNRQVCSLCGKPLLGNRKQLHQIRSFRFVIESVWRM